MEFNKQRLLDNIDALIKQKNLKIGEVEKAVGLSTGYFSRMRKNETSDSAPSVDWIWRLAQYFDVSIEMLLGGDFSNATDNVQYLNRFLKKLIDSTDANKFEWTSISVSDIQKALVEGNTKAYPVISAKPIPDTKDKDYPIYHGDVYNYTSCESKIAEIDDGGILGAYGQYVHGPAYFAPFTNGNTIYLFRFTEDVASVSDYKDAKEIKPQTLYSLFLGYYVAINDPGDEQFIDPDDLEYELKFELVCASSNNEELKPALEMLYQSIHRHDHDIKIDSNTRSAIDEFMNPTQDDGMPF